MAKPNDADVLIWLTVFFGGMLYGLIKYLKAPKCNHITRGGFGKCGRRRIKHF